MFPAAALLEERVERGTSMTTQVPKGVIDPQQNFPKVIGLIPSALHGLLQPELRAPPSIPRLSGPTEQV